MEFLDGESLARRLERNGGKLTSHDIIHLVLQLRARSLSQKRRGDGPASSSPARGMGVAWETAEVSGVYTSRRFCVSVEGAVGALRGAVL